MHLLVWRDPILLLHQKGREEEVILGHSYMMHDLCLLRWHCLRLREEDPHLFLVISETGRLDPQNAKSQKGCVCVCCTGDTLHHFVVHQNLLGLKAFS